MSTVKRVFLYAVAIINLWIMTSGISTLLSLIFNLLFSADVWSRSGRMQLSIGLAMTIIGGVLWLLFWRYIQKQALEDSLEARSGIRKLYINLVLGGMAIAVLTALPRFLQWIFSGVPFDEFPSSSLGTVLVCGCLWFYHWRLEEREGQPSLIAQTLKRWYVYVLTAFGLITLINGVIQLLNGSSLYLPVWGTYTYQGGLWDDVIKVHLSWILVGGATWWFHWFRMAKDDYESTLRHVYLYILPIAGGAIAGLAALTTILYELFRLAFTDAGGDLYFRFLGWTIPTILVAGAVWIYHRKLLQEEAAQLSVNRVPPHRFYLYLMSFIGLGTTLSGIVFLLGTLLDRIFTAVYGSEIFGFGWWGEQLSLSLALLLVGVPIWLYYWRRILRMAGEGGVEERGARSRRVYLYIVLGLTIIAAVTVLVIIIYQVLNGLLQGSFEWNNLQVLTWNISALVTAVPVLVYHWRVLRADQRYGSEKLPRRKRVNLIAGTEASETISRIEEKLGSRIRLLRHTAETPEEVPALSDDEIDTLVEDIKSAAGEGVVLYISGGRINVLPYEEI